MIFSPRANALFRGHEAAVASLHHAAVSGRLHHGWLISGPPGIGKATLAYRFARWLLAGGDAPDFSLPEGHPVARRVAAGTHPDLFTVERRVNPKTDKLQSEIVIATVKEAASFMRLTPAEGGWRVVLVDGAEDMNPNAANALLKLLEEPPARAILILLSAAPGRLLPTIRSRCRALPLAGLADQTVAELLGIYLPELDAERIGKLVSVAGGSIGTALAMAEDGLGVLGLVEEALAGPVAPARAQAIADAVARNVEGADKFERFWWLLRTRLAQATRARAMAGEGAARLAGAVTLWQEFGQLEREVVGLNLDKRAAVIVALSRLHGS